MPPTCELWGPTGLYDPISDFHCHCVFQIDDLLSGTTAVVCGFHFGRLPASNVGDSRVVLGHRIKEEDGAVNRAREEEKTEVGDETTSSSSKSQLIAIPLSSDQTPYRKDERDRVREAGAEGRSLFSSCYSWFHSLRNLNCPITQTLLWILTPQ